MCYFKSIALQLTVAHNARLQRYTYALISSLRPSVGFILDHTAIEVLLAYFTLLILLIFTFFNNKTKDHVSPLSSGAFCRHNRIFKCIWYRHGDRDSIVVLLIDSQQDAQSSNNGSIPRRDFAFSATSWPALGPTQTITHWYQLRLPRG